MNLSLNWERFLFFCLGLAVGCGIAIVLALVP